MNASPPAALAKAPSPVQGLRHSRGFTLIELMITVAIVAILTGIAYPSYRNYVIRSQVVNATNGLSAMQANMERYFQDNRQYTQVSAALPNPCATPVPLGNFTISCQSVTAAAGATPPGFVLQAVGTANVTGFTYTIDQSSNQTTTVAAPAPSAWILTCSASWEMKAGTC